MFGLETGGGGISASSSTGPQRSGDIGGSFFEGINTGSRSGSDTWLMVAIVAAVAVVAVMMLRR